MNRLDALSTSGTIDAAYRRYLRSLMPFNNPAIQDAFHAAVEASSNLLRGPILEMTPPYAAGATIRQLVDARVLSTGMLQLDSLHLPVNRPLYVHQEAACRKAASGRNLVVASGTGSGKTESFLLPILSRLLDEQASGTLTPGVRALLLYPMNALANDQMKRLRQLLADMPEITFGRYTGETRQRFSDARDEFRSINPGEPELPNELISREQMQATPPHLLLTNYAMLEYLLLRPADMDLFEGKHAGSWQFIVVDEAHVYDGAKGAELALLLRRLTQRVAPSRTLQCFATSATVGDAPQAVTGFAQELFNVSVEWVDADPHRQDLVRAERLDVTAPITWGPLGAGDLTALANAPDIDQAVLALANSRGVTAPSAAEALAGESRFHDLVRHLATGPKEAIALAGDIFDDVDAPTAQQGLTALVQVSSAATGGDGSPLLSARYHLMARATEGAFVCLGPEPHVVLARAENCATCGHQVHELASCQRCGAVHLFGVVRPGDIFSPRLTADHDREWLLLDPATTDSEDEDDSTLDTDGAADTEARRLQLCPTCNRLNSAAARSCEAGCTGNLRDVLELPTVQGEPRGCFSCGARTAGILRTFESGNEASVSVLATALYQELPEASDPTVASFPGQGRKVLFFSDSRQQAAFFAPYLQGSYGKLQQRRLISLALSGAYAAGNPVRVDDVQHELVRQARAWGLAGAREGQAGIARKVAPWLMRELMALDGRQSLEGLGLLQVAIERPSAFSAPRPLLALGLSPDEAWDLIEVLVHTLRQQGALAVPAEVDVTSDDFKPRLGPIYAREQRADRRTKVISWLPSRGSNRRVDFLERLETRTGAPIDAPALLSGLWRYLTSLPSSEPILADAQMPNREGVGYQLDYTALLLEPLTVTSVVHRCSSCRQLHRISIRGVCPTHKCQGTLERVDVADLAEADDHYRSLYQTMRPVSLTVMEHTAQWQPQEAAKIQQQFVEGRLNALSCSTTFELGVDVGELESVVMRNVPPSTANYVQRAGRAGRRSKSAALVLTYAQRRSHDLSRFAAPLDLISGLVESPRISISNERLARRHVHSVALSAFWRHAATTWHQTWKDAGAFLLPPEDAPTDPAPYEHLRSWLDPVPDHLRQALYTVVPSALHDELGIQGDGWVKPMLDLLDTVAEELSSLVDFFSQRRQEAFDQGQDNLVSRFGRILETLRRRQLLGYLATKNVLPKYGFPVDVVELRTQHTGDQLGRLLSLERDLSSAIYEYAPGSQIVAGGRVWTSGGIYRLPKRDLIEAKYIRCTRCDAFHAGVDEPGLVCTQCGTQLTGRPRTYLIPEFGFVAAQQSSATGEKAPRQSWNGSTHILRLPQDAAERAVRTIGGEITLRAGQRGTLVKLSEGPAGAGFLICEWCGFGRPTARQGDRQHQHPMTGRACTGTLRPRTLAHEYETDFLEIRPRLAAVPPWSAAGTWRSVMYGLLEGASYALDLARDDIDAALHHDPTEGPVIAIVDAVPGGAGLALRVGDSFDRVVAAARRRLDACDCEPVTSCYACLRSYSNQRYHHELSRGEALTVIEQMVVS